MLSPGRAIQNAQALIFLWTIDHAGMWLFHFIYKSGGFIKKRFLDGYFMKGVFFRGYNPMDSEARNFHNSILSTRQFGRCSYGTPRCKLSVPVILNLIVEPMLPMECQGPPDLSQAVLN